MLRVCLCMYTLCYLLLVLYKNEGDRSTRLGEKSSQSSSICLVANERPLFNGIREGRKREKRGGWVIFFLAEIGISLVQIKSSMNSGN